MEDRALYQAILGLAVPWDVLRVELREAEQTVQVFVDATPGTLFACQTAGRPRRSMTMPSAGGGIWIPASSPRSSWRACRACSA